MPVVPLTRWSRIGEVLGVGAVVVVCIPLFAGWHPEVDLVRATFTTERTEFLIVAMTSTWWVALCFALPLDRRGRSYLRDDAGRELTTQNMNTHADSLTIAGLVLAGLALGPATTVGKASTPLVAALTAFVAAWAAGFIPGRMSSTIVGDTLHWIGLGCMLAAVYSMAIALDPETYGPRVAVLGASLIVGIYSFLHARAHWRSAHLPDAPAPNPPGRC
jgi:hypothetical protein